MYKKFLLGRIIVLGATTVAVSATILLEVAHLSDVIKEHGHTIRSWAKATSRAPTRAARRRS